MASAVTVAAANGLRTAILLPSALPNDHGSRNRICFRYCDSLLSFRRRSNSPIPLKPFCSLADDRKILFKDDKDEIPFNAPENALIGALIGIQGRGRSASPQQLQDVQLAVSALEDIEGIPNPTSSSTIEGRWQLMFTTRPGTASPIQRTFVGVDFFSVFQEISLRTNDPRVSNIVKFSDAIGELKVEAAASIKDGRRILFTFDRAAFSFKFLPFKVPYPVPFRLLGDEAKGWLDTTYLSPSGNIRISRGNKCREPHLFCKRKLIQGRICLQLLQQKQGLEKYGLSKNQNSFSR